MRHSKNLFIPFDLLSNFLTITYLDTLETLFPYNDQQADTSLETIKALKSFLFIVQNNKTNITILQKQIFDFYTPYTLLSPSQMFYQETTLYPEIVKIFSSNRRPLTIQTLRKIYTKNILSVKKQLSYDLGKHYNITFIHVHRNLVYHRFKEESSLPLLLKANTAENFIIYAWEYYLDYLVSTRHFEYLSEAIKSLSYSTLPFASHLLSYLKDKLYLSQYSNELELLIKQLS